MNSSIRKSVITIAAAAAVSFSLAGSVHAASDELVAAAKEEGRVVWYTTLIVDQAVRPLVAAFEEKYPGIKVEFARAGSAETALKIINEAQAGRPQADVFDGTATYSSIGPAGLAQSYVPESVAAFTDATKSEKGEWHALNNYYLTVAYNTDLVSAEEAPRTYEDLLDAKWKDQMVWSVEPEPAAAPGFLGNMMMTMGEEKGAEYIQKLKGQGLTNMLTSQRAVMDRLIAGDFSICLMCFSHHAVISQGKGAPVEWARMKPVVNVGSLMGIVKDGPNPNAAKLFVEYMFSVEGQTTLAGAGYIPAHPDVPAKHPELKPTDAADSFTANTYTPALVDEMLPGWVKIMSDNFL